MTRLRKMMLEELQRHNYSAITTRYLRVVSDFAKHFGKSHYYCDRPASDMLAGP